MNSDSHKRQVAEIRRLIAMLGGQSWTLHQSARLHGSAGIPDMCAIVRGRAFWIEVKVGRDKLRPAQAAFKAAWEAAGLPVIVGRASDVVDWLEMRRKEGARAAQAANSGPCACLATLSGACARSGDAGAISGEMEANDE